MRPLLTCALLTLSVAVPVTLAVAATAVRRPIPTALTVVMDFKGAHSDRSISEMERESATLLKDAGIKLDWRLRSQSAGKSYADLVVMTFNGSCKMDPSTARVYDELGILASTKTTDHIIQSFGQVDCDHVVKSARSAMSGGDFSRSDLLLGRALGRVVVHEIVHMLTRSAQHGREGVFEASLSGKQLIAPTLPLSAVDVDHLLEGEFAERQPAVPVTRN